MSLLDDLVGRYAAANIQFPVLKPVTLAQWLLESGRASSALAVQHLNFGGLKWRSEMVGYATPVQYQAHDGLDYYCKFASLDAYILGYWRFLSRSPYHGWENHAHDPAAFMAFIGGIYNPNGAAYVQQVMDLVPEATSRLNNAPQLAPFAPIPPVVGTPVVIVIDPGHGGTVKVGDSSPNNATSPSGEKEKNWTLDVAKRAHAAVLTEAISAGKNVRVILTRESDVNLGLSARANVAKVNGAKLFLSIHFNASEGHNARGVETLIRDVNVNLDEDRVLAAAVQAEVLAALNAIDPSTVNMPKYNRGVKQQRLGVLDDIALGNTQASHPCAACLLEVEFMDTQAVEDLFIMSPADAARAPITAANRQKIAEAIARAVVAQA